MLNSFFLIFDLDILLSRLKNAKESLLVQLIMMIILIAGICNVALNEKKRPAFDSSDSNSELTNVGYDEHSEPESCVRFEENFDFGKCCVSKCRHI